jgi:hypothetical protein
MCMRVQFKKGKGHYSLSLWWQLLPTSPTKRRKKEKDRWRQVEGEWGCI